MLEALIKEANSFKLSIEQLCFCKYLYYSKDVNNTQLASLYIDYYGNNREFHNYEKIVDVLVKSGYVENNNIAGEYYFKKMFVTKSFLKDEIIDIDTAWFDVVSNYPLFLTINNRAQSLHTTKHPNLKKYYYHNVIKGGNKNLHEKVLFVINMKYDNKKTITNGVGLEKFLLSFDSMVLEIEHEANNNNDSEYIFG
jgi:hypothetical protein